MATTTTKIEKKREKSFYSIRVFPVPYSGSDDVSLLPLC